MAIVALALVFLFAAAQPCQAVPLAAGTAVAAVAEPEPGAGAIQLFTTGSIAFVAPTYTGTLVSSVYNNDITNPFGLAGLTFTYLLHNNASSAHELHRFTVSSFANFGTDVSYSSVAAPGIPPTFIDRGLPGDVVGFNYPTPVPQFLPSNGSIGPGGTSSLMVIQTDAVNFTPTLASVIDGSVTMVASLAPAPIIPEPGSIVLAGMSVLGLAAVCWRRRRR
jgi:hypothetical protein